MFLPAVSWLALRFWKRRDPAAIVLLIGFLGQWLPWALVPRIAFIYHFLPAVPFGCLAIASVLVTLFGKGFSGRAVAMAYAALVIGFFVYFYPIYAAIPLTPPAFENRMWFSSWR
jgi:dolichyl-phosphate-mannose--protein O-mannosyl transferase